MTSTITHAATRFVRYNNGMGMGPFSWTDDVRMIGQGMIFAVTAAGLPALLRYLHGSEVERAYFTPVEPEYVAGLRHCAACNVYFEHPSLEQRHVRFHQERQQSSPELARLAKLDSLDAQDREAIREAELRIVERDEERKALRASIADSGLEPVLVDGLAAGQEDGSRPSSDASQPISVGA